MKLLAHFCIVPTRYLVNWLFVILLLGNMPGQANEHKHGMMNIDIAVLPGVEQYIDLLAHPSYVAIALENTEIVPWHPVIVDGHALEYKSAVLRFLGRDGSRLSYRLRVVLGFAGVDKNFDIPIEIETLKIRQGRIIVHVQPPLANLFPNFLIDKLSAKIKTLAAVPIQKKMLTYLNGLSKKLPQGAKPSRLREQILFDSYNHPAKSVGYAPREPGDAESLQDQWMLLATLAIWFIILPLVMLVIYFRRRFRRRHVSG